MQFARWKMKVLLLFITHYSLFIIHYSLLIIHYIPRLSFRHVECSLRNPDALYRILSWNPYKLNKKINYLKLI